MNGDAPAHDALAPVNANGQSTCNGCKGSLEDTSDSVVVAFGDRLWHVNCFRCAKCRNPVEYDSNLLLLSDGSPVCANCSYICSLCNQLIQHEAIVTGDESFHADCFRCKSCRKRIEELVFAKTSTGLWCLECHHARLARSRKHSEAKRNRNAKADGSKREASTSLPNGSAAAAADSAAPLAVPAIPSQVATPSPTSTSYVSARSAPPSPLPPSASLPLLSLQTQNGERTPKQHSPAETIGNGQLSLMRPSTAEGLVTPPLESTNMANGLLPPSPAEKQANRRSGFYGVPSASAPDTDWQSLASPTSDEGNVPDLPPKTSTSSHETLPQPPALEDMSKSISFYDADLLASPGKSNGVDEESSELMAALELEESMDTVTHRLRESIRQSRSLPAVSSAGVVDVDAVELLLTELVATKERMKELQGRYNEAKRASSQVFEGINQAREEIEQEVAARREAESEMGKLKEQLRDQASRLGQLNVMQQRTEALQRRSMELSTTVVGIERQLASLKAERDISVAEVEQLKRFSAGSSDQLQAEGLVPSLDVKLAEIKQQHRSELDALLSEKEAISRETEEMRQMRDLFAGEAAALNQTNQELSQQNTALNRQVDQARATLLRLQQQTLSLNAVNGHEKNLSTASRPSVSATTGRSSPSSEVSPDGTAVAKRVDTSPAPRKFKWGKSSKTDTVRPMNSFSNLAASSKPVRTASMQNNRGDAPLPLAQHLLQPVSILRPQRCDACGEKMWGWQEKCAHCPLVCHTRCGEQLAASCTGSSSDAAGSPKGVLLGRDLADRCAAEGSAIPRIVTACLDAVEARGMDHEGIYRKSGGTGQVRTIESLFESDKPIDLLDDERFNDISAVTSALKNYFRSLPDCLYTAGLHEAFMTAGAIRNNDELQAIKVGEVLARLPEAHKTTLSRLMLHLHRVTLQSEANKMTPANLGVVFGPTLLRAGTADALDGMQDLQHRNRVVEICVMHATRYFA